MEYGEEIRIVRYNDEYKKVWNDFVKCSKSSMFMFDRNYMDYHKNQFVDYSLLFYEKDKLIALLPANINGREVISHGGLTYGGLLYGVDIKQHVINRCIDSLIRFLNEEKIQKLHYKSVPFIYSVQPAEEDIYALFRAGASLEEVSASTAINLQDPLKISHGRKNNYNKAKKKDIEIREVLSQKEYDVFIDLENEVLEGRHNTKAVHSGKELFMLHENFPDNIHLLCAYYENSMIAGVVYYEYDNVVHTQYMAANEIAKKNGALDAIVIMIINRFTGQKKWLDFGISTENHGKILNNGLIFQKEGFGGRTVVYEHWLLKLNEV